MNCSESCVDGDGRVPLPANLCVKGLKREDAVRIWGFHIFDHEIVIDL